MNAIRACISARLATNLGTDLGTDLGSTDLDSTGAVVGSHTAVIGAGIGGLAVAIRRACAGDRVTVFEASAHAGGKLSAFALGPYRFDLGPSLFTMPELIDELFELAGEDPRDHFEYVSLPIACRYFFQREDRAGPDAVLDGYADPTRFAQEAERVLGVPARSVQRYLARSRERFERTRGVFLERSLHRLGTFFSKDALATLFWLPRLGLVRSMHRENQSAFDDPRMVQLFDRFATYNGSDPYRAPAVLTMIPHLELGKGAYFPTRGMVSITESLVALALRKGVHFRMSSPVEQIEVERGRARGVVLRGGERVRADAVISNADVSATYRHLLPDQKPPKRILREEKSTSAIVFYWGIRGHHPELDVHNILFSSDYRREFQAIAADAIGEVDPTIYVHISSRICPDDAPRGHENWFVMVNVAADRGQEWSRIVAEVRQRVLDRLEATLGHSIEPLIAEEAILDPPTLEARTGSVQGALYGSASNDRFAAFWRHPNFTRRIPNLFFCGGSVHPGGGIPLCVLSAKIVSDMLG